LHHPPPTHCIAQVVPLCVTPTLQAVSPGDAIALFPIEEKNTRLLNNSSPRE